jgi:hypothetical protein
LSRDRSRLPLHSLGSLLGSQQGAAKDVFNVDFVLSEKPAHGCRLPQSKIAQGSLAVVELSALEGFAVSKKIQVHAGALMRGGSSASGFFDPSGRLSLW